MALNAPSDGGVQGPLDVTAIEAEDDQLDARPGLLDRRDQWRDSVSWLNQELHACLLTSGHAGCARRRRDATPVLPREGGAVLGLRRRVSRPPEDAAVERSPLWGDGFEEHLVSGDFHDHEMVFRRTDCVEGAMVEVVKIPAAAARHEIPDPLLGCDPLVQMIV